MATVKAHCNTCSGDTNHEVLFTNKEDWDDHNEYYTVSGWVEHQLLKCMGCEAIRLCRSSFNDSDGETEVEFFPPTYAREEPNWLGSLRYAWGDDEKEKVGRYLQEIYVAMHNGSLWLSAIGVRSLLEFVMIAKVKDQGSFGKNLKAFVEAGFLSSAHAEYLDTTLEAGHASTHRAWKPTEGQMNTLMDVTESVIEAVYVLKDKVAALKAVVPPRPKKA